MDMEIAKAGWLHRQSTVLHRWKKHWFVLYKNGDLKYFDSPSSYHPCEEKLVVYAVCLGIKTGRGCNFNPPDGQTKDSLLCLALRDGEMRLCAENPDDTKAWQIALEEARVLQTPSGVNQTVMYGAPGTQVMYTNTVSNAYPGYVVTPPGTYVVPNAASSNAIIVGNTPGQVMHYRRHGYRPCYSRGFVCGPVLWW